MKRVLLDQLIALEDSDVFEEFYLHSPQRVPELDALLRASLPNIGQMNFSLLMTTPTGSMKKGDLVSACVDGCSMFGFARIFASGPSLASGHRQCYALLQKCQRCDPRSWKPLDDVLLVRSADLGEAVPYIRLLDGVRPCVMGARP